MTHSTPEDFLLGEWLSWSPQSLSPSSWNRQVPFACWLFESLSPNLCVELGTGSGQSFRALCQVADRFASGARLVGVDQWPVETSAFWRRNAEYEALSEYCATRLPDRAALLRMPLNEAVGEFADGSIDFLHVAPLGDGIGGSVPDLALWMPKIRPGGVVVVSSIVGDKPDDATQKLWHQLAEYCPFVSLAGPDLAGIGQVPADDGSRIVEILRTHSKSVSSLLRVLAERIEFRHLLGSEPVTAGGLRRHLAESIDVHAEEVARITAQSQEAREALQQELASISEQLLARWRQAEELQTEADCLLAKLAVQAAAHERELEGLRRELDRSVDERKRLEGEVEQREALIQAVTRTLSWRLTRPLRMIQSARMTRRAR